VKYEKEPEAGTPKCATETSGKGTDTQSFTRKEDPDDMKGSGDEGKRTGSSEKKEALPSKRERKGRHYC